MSPIGGVWRKLNAGAKLQTVPYPTVSVLPQMNKTIVYFGNLYKLLIYFNDVLR